MSHGIFYTPYKPSVKADDEPIFRGESIPFAPESLNVTLHGNEFALYVPSVEYDFNGINSDEE